jgi:DNA ligase-1
MKKQKSLVSFFQKPTKRKIDQVQSTEDNGSKTSQIKKKIKHSRVIDDNEEEVLEEKVEVLGKLDEKIESDNEEDLMESESEENAVQSGEIEEDEASACEEETATGNVKLINVVKPSKKLSGTPIYEYAKYDAIKAATWKKNEKVPYMFLAKTFDNIAATSSRIKITELLTNCFRSIICLTPEDLLPAVYLCTNRIAPAHEGIELGVGDGLLLKTLAEATGKSLQVIKKQYSDEGDLGTVAKNVRGTQKTMFQPKPLTIAGVFKDFKFIATAQGKNSMQKKADKIKSLLVSSKDVEPQYIIRSLQGKLRIGLGEETVLVSLAHAIVLTGVGTGEVKAVTKNIRAEDLKNAEEILKMVYSELPWYDKIIEELLAHGLKNLPNTCKLTVGIPIRPMLAKASKGVQEILKRFGTQSFTCEYKYDGERQQVHILPDGKIKLYSRNLEDTTGKFPDLIEMLPQAMKPITNSAILDCEVVAYDAAENKIKPFQILSTRGRKNITLKDIKIPVCLFAFDLLYLNGESLLKKPLSERREKLYSHFQPVDAKFQFAAHLDSNDTEVIQEFLSDAIKSGCEGLIIKSLTNDASYEPSRRTFNWLKLKKDYIQGLGDSFDLIPIGGYKGKGKRTGVYGGFLLACYDPSSETYQSICKIGTGFSDEMLKNLSQTLNEYIIDGPKSYYSYADVHEPDVWFDVKQVWEVLAADLTLSPGHTAAIGLIDDSRGIALRFPRFVRVRTDKTPEEATTSEQVAEFYKKQSLQA